MDVSPDLARALRRTDSAGGKAAREAGGPDGRAAALSEEAIARLVERFYARVRRDVELGPIFNDAIPPDGWDGHLSTLRDFWSSVMLGSGRYKGNPFAAHMRIDRIRPELFERWLGLFSETADEVFAPAIADAFREKAGRIAQSISIGLFYRPELDRPKRP